MVEIINFLSKIDSFISVKNFKTRFLTTIILLSVFCSLFILGEVVLSLFFVFLYGGLLYELKKNHLKNVNFFQKMIVFFLPFLLFIFFIFEIKNIVSYFFNFNNYNFLLFVSLLLCLIFFYSFKNIYYTLISILLVYSFFSLIKALLVSEGLTIIFYLVMLVTAMDVFAYLGGNVFGKTKIAPKISSGKTIEGTFFGLFITILISFSFRDLLSLNVFNSIFFGICVGLLAFLGDLIESSFKRKVGVKDSGNIIPGHGGLLDRFDGYILVIPFSFIFFDFIV